MTSLEVEIRPDSGKGVARKLRAAGKLPGVVYGPGNEPVPVAVDPVALTQVFKKSGNRNMLLELDLDGTKVSCLVREVQRHPLSRELLHVDFFRVDNAKSVLVEVPVVTTGKPKGATLGGRLRLIRRSLMARCLPGNIPESFAIDAAPLDIGDRVSSADLTLPEGVSLTLTQHIDVLECYGKSKRQIAQAAAEAEAEAEAEGGDAAAADDAPEAEA